MFVEYPRCVDLCDCFMLNFIFTPYPCFSSYVMNSDDRTTRDKHIGVGGSTSYIVNICSSISSNHVLGIF